jgi:hypothetical protein
MRLILFLSLMLLSGICSGQTKPIGEAPVILDEFDFTSKISALYPDKYKSRQYKNYYEIPSRFSLLGYSGVIKEVTYENEFDQELKKSVGIEYRQQSSSKADVLAVFGKQPFNKINFATTLNGKIKIVGAAAINISKSESETLIRQITSKYGKFTKRKGEFGKVFEIYEWKSKDRMVRYAPLLDDESNSLKNDIDRNNKTIKSGKKKSHLKAYLYIIRNEFIKDMAKTKIGDFAYLNED